MYEERKESFSIKDLIIQVLFVGVFIFLLVWLFPTKNSVKKTFAPLYDQIFNQNVMIMKDAAITYYTTPRLPQNVGDEKKMTLDEMLKANLVLPFVDSKGNQCDLQESYVSITKMSDEYILKINLKCSDQEDYLLVHLGCYDYCDGDVCEKEETEPTPNPEPTPDPKPTPDPEPVVNYEYLYEYVLVIDGKWGEYSDWSKWTKNVITETDYRAVETKVVNETTYETKKEVIKEPIYETRRVQTGTKQEAYQDTVTVTKYRTVPVYENKKVQVGTKPVYKTETVKVPITEDVPVYETKTVTKYKTVPKFVKMEYSLDCTDTCKRVEKPVYETVQEPYTVTEKVQTGTRRVTTGFKEETKQVISGYEPIYETRRVQTGTKQEAYQDTVTVTKYRSVPVYSDVTVKVGEKDVVVEKQVPVTKKVTYYRSKTREFIDGTVKTEWSKSKQDSNLLSQGYTLTGNVKKIEVK